MKISLTDISDAALNEAYDYAFTKGYKVRIANTCALRQKLGQFVLVFDVTIDGEKEEEVFRTAWACVRAARLLPSSIITPPVTRVNSDMPSRENLDFETHVPPVCSGGIER